MRTFKVNVNGNTYEVQLEEVSASEIKSAPVQNTVPAAPAEGREVKAPIAGTILTVNVSTGASVKAGDVLMVLEAMKMENEICAPCDGKITSVAVSGGASVQSGALLCTIG